MTGDVGAAGDTGGQRRQRRRGHLRLGRHDHALAHRRHRPSSGASSPASTTRRGRAGSRRRAGHPHLGGGERPAGPAAATRAPRPASRTSSPRPGSSPTTRAPWRASPRTRRSGSRTPGPTLQIRPLWEGLRDNEIRVGVLSNTIWSREYHRGLLARDGVLDLVDADVYSSETPWVKPQPGDLPRRLAADRRRAGAVRVRRRPRVRGRARPAVGGDARDPGAAQRHPGEPAGASRRDPGRRGPRAARRPRHRRCAGTGGADRRCPTPRWTRHCSPSPSSPRPRSSPAGSTRSSGGGGLVQLPALLLGFPTASPAQILATNKFSSIFGTTTSAVTYYRRVHPDLRTALPMAGVAFLGSVARRAHRAAHPQGRVQPDRPRLPRRRRRLHAPQARARPGDGRCAGAATSTGWRRCSSGSSSGSTTARSDPVPGRSSSSPSSG